MNNTNPLSIAREALEELQNWFQSERKSISKGNGSSWSMFQCDEKIAEIASVLAALDAAAQQEPLPKPRFNCWSNDDGDSWLEHPADCEFIHGLKIGDIYELLAGWTSVRAAYRVTKAPDDQDDDYEVECVSHPEQNAASPAQPTHIENAENYARSDDMYRKEDVSIQVACEYCTSDIPAIKQIYFNQNCADCVKRMGNRSIDPVDTSLDTPQAQPVISDEESAKIEAGSSALNDACWKFVDVMPHELPGHIFNDLKPAVKAAIEHFLSAQEKQNRPTATSADGLQTVSDDDLFHVAVLASTLANGSLYRLSQHEVVVAIRASFMGPDTAREFKVANRKPAANGAGVLE